jgi:tetratricopeptide (TPR) repeat protein
VPANADGRAALYRSLLSDRRMLILLDNAAETTQVEPLLPGHGSCMTVLTSRNRLDGLIVHRGAERISLDVLAPREARTLMAEYLGQDRVIAEPEAVAEAATKCGHLPLALTLVAVRAAAYPGHFLRTVIDELGDGRDRLDALDTGDLTTNLRDVFSWSYRRLRPDTARVFRLLGLHPGPDIGVPAAAALAGISEREALRHLGVLSGAHLVEEPMPRRFRFHDLLRIYAAERAGEEETAADRQRALRGVLDSYLHTAHNASRRLNEHRLPIPLGVPQPAAVIAGFDTHDKAMRWFQEEYQNLLATIEWAAERDLADYAWRLALTFWQYLYLCGRWNELIAIHETVLPAAENAAEPTACAAVHTNLGVGEAQLGNHQAALSHFRKALLEFRRIGDQAGQGNALDSLAWVHTLAGDFPEAVDLCEQALAVYRQTGDRDGQARTLDSLGVAHAGLGRYDRAIDYGQQALELHVETANRIGQAHTLRSLGQCYAGKGDQYQAAMRYQQALIHCREIGDRYDEAGNLRDLGSALAELHEFDEARKYWEQALSILNELRHPSATAVKTDLATLPTSPA